MGKSRKTKFELYVIQKVKEKRLTLEKSQEDIAFLLDMTRGFIGQIESPASPSKYNLNHLNKLAQELGCSPKDFLPDKAISEQLRKRKI
jgi:transcriptional regulator with XRE-family HTH domain